MKRIFFLLMIIVPQITFGQKDEINWIGFEELEDSLKTENKPVVIYFYTDWCVYCKKMDRNAFRNKEVIQKLNTEFYAVKMDAESVENIEFEGQIFTNEQQKTNRRGIHQIPLLLASRKDKPISFPVVMVLDANFQVKRKSHEYLTTDNLKTLIKID
ncbi:thioredoxin family protein [Gramella lutea]|uniref:Thioredoxin family protein n=1 Tax=Christiangramia lutea TaxID=1607951 RepID=A0A9X1V1V3_9FLAO|nr:thioredoxin family protein [Christiangramia lutea]MCH4822574.1 thioredoxin family protein [Christiangramia lutea]